MILQAKNLGKRFGEEIILQNVNFSAVTGRSAVIVGGSGKGKSTLLSMLGLLLQPTQGELTLDGEDLLGLKDAQAARCRNRSFGFLFQSTQLIGSLTVLDNVLIPACIAGRRDLKHAACQALEEVGLAERLYHYPHQLSIGQKRRVALVRAMILQPHFLFADEPTNDLDEENAALVSDALFASVGEQTGLILVTHDMHLARRADEAFLVDRQSLVPVDLTRKG